MAITKIGTPELFDFSATNTALQLPTGPTSGTGGRPSNPSTGEWRFNTTLKYVEYWDGGAWRQIDTEATGNPDDFPSQNFNVNTYFGTGAARTIDAKFNEAANFNGASSGSQIFIADADVFSPANNDLSFSVWVKTSSTSGGYFVSKQDDGTVTYEWQFYMNTNGTVVIGIFTSAGSTIATATSTATVNDGNWHNVAFVIDTNTSITVYVDKAGVTNSSWSGTMSNTSTDVLLGAGGGVPSFRLQGMLDQARFFNTAITQSQIDSLYDSETTTTAATLDFPSGAGCFAAYQLDGDASDVGGTYGGVETNIGYTGLKFKPDFTWIKWRTGPAGGEHTLFDSVRGVGNFINSNLTTQQRTNNTTLTSFDSNGFTLGTDSIGYVNYNIGDPYVAWNWYAPTAETNNAGSNGATITSTIKKNVDAGFSIVKHTGTGGTGTVGTGLSSPAELIIRKNLEATSTAGVDWYVYAPVSPYFGYLNFPDAFNSGNNAAYSYNQTVPTGSIFNVGNTYSGNINNDDYIAYCFHSVAGYQKVGSYTGNRPGTKTVYTTDDGTSTGQNGFKPSFLMIKDATTAAGEDWIIVDNKREGASAPTKVLYPNTNASEDPYTVITFTSNGFTVGDTGLANTSGASIIFLAIA